MRPIKIRDLETGEVLTRHGATAMEILDQRARFCREGREPRAWKEAHAAKLTEQAEAQPAEEKPKRSQRKKKDVEE